jgi:prolyl-tRNA editing enzyme YbaK/EbsC (Cys-tRNA(Pro) deacylase)
MTLYSTKEQETVLTFDNETKEWSAYSCVPKHIRKLVDLLGAENVTVIEKDGDSILAVKCTLQEKQVSMKKLRQYSEEQKREMAERMRAVRGATN